jgi:hypothetical protein
MKKHQRSILALALITTFIALLLFLPGLIHAGDLKLPDRSKAYADNSSRKVSFQKRTITRRLFNINDSCYYDEYF